MNQIAPSPLVEPYRLAADQVLLSLGTDAQLGLTAQEAETRLERVGRNELAAEHPVPVWRKLLGREVFSNDGPADVGS